jgi:hypothetical protein
MSKITHVIPRMSHEETTVALIRYELGSNADPGDASLSRILPKLINAVTSWVENTEEGRACYEYAGNDLNIGDVASHGGEQYVAIQMSLHDLLGFKIEVFCCLENSPGMTYDTSLVDPDIGLADNDEFRCEKCKQVFDIENSVKPEGKKGPIICVECSEDATDAPQSDESWIDKHSVNCYFCGTLCDERECIPADEHNDGDGGDMCPGCQKKAENGIKLGD